MEKIAVVKSCLLPLDLYYRIEDHIWVRREAEGTVTLGLTDMAQTTAGRILVITFKPAGRLYERGKVIAIVESGKWLGPIRTPLTGELVRVNESLYREPDLINRSPYQRGWLAQLRPWAWEEESFLLVSGEGAVKAYYEEFMMARGLDDCVHCEGFEPP